MAIAIRRNSRSRNWPEASKIFWTQASMFGDSGEHLWPYLVTIVKGENEVRPPGSCHRSVRS